MSYFLLAAIYVFPSVFSPVLYLYEIIESRYFISKQGPCMALQPITPHISDVDNFLTHCHRRRYPNHATIIYEDDSCDTLYYIISESVSIVLEDNDGKESSLRI